MSDNANVVSAFEAAKAAAAVEEANTGLTKLTGSDEKKEQGSFVLQNQPLADKEGFSHVSKIWYGKTMSYEQGLEQIETGRAATEDVLATLAEMQPAVDANGRFAFRHVPTDRFFVPTGHAIRQAGTWAGTGTWYVENLLENATDLKGRPLYARDKGDSEAIAFALANGFRRVDQKKPFLWRTRNDGTLRAMLTDRYAIVDNRWFVEKLKDFIPGGRLSHWRGDSDTLYGNVLIPDTIREDSDSDYGGMLSIGNSEIGERRVSSTPSIFRAICMNGCIWGATVGKGIRQVHRGRIDLNILAAEIKSNLNKQIPLLPQGIEKFLNMRSMVWKDTSAKPVIAATAREFKLGKRQASAVLEAFHREAAITPDFEKSLFTVTNAVTRAGQKQDANADWLRFDEVGGELMEYSAADFSRLIGRANSLTVKEVEEAFAGV